MEGVIFTDFFDTIVFRHIHPFLIVDRMANLMSNKGVCPKAQFFLRARAEVMTELLSKNIEINALDLYGGIYKRLEIDSLPQNEFIDYCVEIEEAIEIGTQYVNKKYVDYLQKEKNSGKRIYIISDFHLGKSSIIAFLKARNVPLDLFDDIFVSCDYNKSKSGGELYLEVLTRLGLSGHEVLMIGDNKWSDGKSAERFGIKSRIIRNYYPKFKYQLRRFLGYNYPKNAFRKISATCYDNGAPFCEYALVYYCFVKELYARLQNKGITDVAFLAREGHFLKRMFELYIHLKSPYGETINNNYIKCSRRASTTVDEEKLVAFLDKKISIRNLLKAYGYDVTSINAFQKEYGIIDDDFDNSEVIMRENQVYLQLVRNADFDNMLLNKVKDSKAAFRTYLKNKSKGKLLTLVDIGWKGSMQEIIAKYFEGETIGFYLGINECSYDLKSREGLVFMSCMQTDVKTRYSQILKTNIQLYEQLAAAPHGSTLGYSFENGNVQIAEEWSENEEKFYKNEISRIQDEMLLILRGVSVWTDEMPRDKMLKECARLVLRAALFADKSRLSFLRRLDNAFFDNFGQETKGLTFDKKNIPLSLNILYKPEEYTHFFAKLQRILYAKNKRLNVLYLPIAYMVYWYVWCFTIIKNKFSIVC